MAVGHPLYRFRELSVALPESRLSCDGSQWTGPPGAMLRDARSIRESSRPSFSLCSYLCPAVLGILREPGPDSGHLVRRESLDGGGDFFDRAHAHLALNARGWAALKTSVPTHPQDLSHPFPWRPACWLPRPMSTMRERMPPSALRAASALLGFAGELGGEGRIGSGLATLGTRLRARKGAESRRRACGVQYLT